MKNYKQIEFNCLEENCRNAIRLDMERIGVGKKTNIKCSHCSKEYSFNGNFVEKISKFDTLVSAIKDAKEILGDTNVAVNFKNREIRIPYRLLLTRMNTLLSLTVGDKKVEFRFRVEPLDEMDIHVNKCSESK